jgi:hypothetical protein
MLTTHETAILLLGLGGLAVALFVLFFAIPWLAKRWAVYKLHDIRDEMAEVAAENPALLRTLVYRDIDALLAVALHLTREHSGVDAHAFLGALGGGGSNDSWRARQHRFELGRIETDPDLFEAAKIVASAIERARQCIQFSVPMPAQRLHSCDSAIASHPMILVLGIVAGRVRLYGYGDGKL